MDFKSWCYIIVFLVLGACSSDDPTIHTLQDLIQVNSHLQQDEVIACAASKKDNNQIAYVFYYPIPTATNIQYFETENTQVDKNNFSLYKPIDLPKEDVFNGYLGRFVRDNNKETWCIVTYMSNGKFHKSNPILLKHQNKPTEWTDNVTIDSNSSLSSKFYWEDGTVKENAIYFQVLTDASNNLLSGTYTYEKCFQYYNTSNVVLNVTRNEPPNLIANNEYHFTMMGVSEDNWVNLVIQKSFKVE
ncbi:hypothetical protein WH52_12900 [Tenacibaculum holothuriorum]|uniref:Lipoprotein n=1 Tax=Tenacibaculum holothuriorum TaxID=1635173 RepID=A0A1Y2PBU0_9FLAO|nr:hypothetical protein [Tenacibaculum holothuriorum]OSY87158.1 hypothetical protein WH52_12900 [Tenacibaculum holothuriorum]